MLRKTLVLGSVLLLSGCASFWNIGESEFMCDGMPSDTPEKAECLSAREAYFATNDGAVPRPMLRKTKEQEEAIDHVSAQQYTNDQIVKEYVTPNLPDRPVPIRTPAKVMRIWVSPWEDDAGDLNTVGYIYTEIEPRRWVIGDRAEYAGATLYPLQAPMNRMSSQRPQEAANTNRGSETGSVNQTDRLTPYTDD